jgi:hypothetical protein
VESGGVIAEQDDRALTATGQDGTRRMEVTGLRFQWQAVQVKAQP